MEVEILEEISEKLEQIRRLLAIQSIAASEECRNLIEKKYLTTDQRKKMYSLFDGMTSNSDIGKKVGTSAEAVRLLVQDLERVGAVEMVKGKGNLRFPLRMVW